MDKLIGQFEKNSREEIRVQLREFKGHQLLDIRIFYFTADGGEPKPSPKGISMSIKLLPQLQEALLEGERVLKEEGLMSPEGVVSTEDQAQEGSDK